MGTSVRKMYDAELLQLDTMLARMGHAAGGAIVFVPLHPIAEKILSLYNTTDDSKPVFPLGEKKALR